MVYILRLYFKKKMFFIDFTLDYCDIYILFRILTWHATFALKTIEGSK
jgi:hypothetical protein